MQLNRGFSLLEVLISGFIGLTVIFSVRLMLTWQLIQVQSIYQHLLSQSA